MLYDAQHTYTPLGAPRVPNPVTYAEKTLDAHGVYERAQRALAAMDAAHEDANAASAELRVLEEAIADREADLVIECRVKHPDLKTTDFAREVKAMAQADEKMRLHRDALRSAKSKHDDALRRIAVERRRVEIETARMTELGGLLNFYAMRTPPPSPATPNTGEGPST